MMTERSISPMIFSLRVYCYYKLMLYPKKYERKFKKSCPHNGLNKSGTNIAKF
jgi:hypothetical protein